MGACKKKKELDQSRVKQAEEEQINRMGGAECISTEVREYDD